MDEPKDDEINKNSKYKKIFIIVCILILVGAGVALLVNSNKNKYLGGSGPCNNNYSGCVPNKPYDINCKDVGHTVNVLKKDVYHLDGNNNGRGCESYS